MITAQAEDGRKVILYEDGRWEYVQESSSDISNDEKYDFRKVNWGASKEQVKASETAKFIGEQKDCLFYTDTIAGMKSMFVYSFHSNCLKSAMFDFEEELVNQERTSVDKFYFLQTALTNKYGHAVGHEQIWRNNQYKSDPAGHSTAVLYGHLKYSTNWQTDTTDISLQLDGREGKILFFVNYTSISYMRNMADLPTSSLVEEVQTQAMNDL